ncbi:protein FAM83G isoform X2 [Trichomycterus rosablanca]|uniref:protein FAM83G isoform X2 n=1 Tax=Trichomycterus rosablanca TaxID=2290929 RepID=UPI002F358236
MSYSQQQSLDNDVVFFPVNDSNPEFLHCERERSALECLLSGGTGAFYNKLGADQLCPFLSPSEVDQVSSWTEDYRSSENLENGDAGSEISLDMDSGQYLPAQSDTPAPCLDLGWPEKDRWDCVERAMVYTNPPLPQAPHIREVIRTLLQGATTLIAIVADRLTDSTVIGDLNLAASRGVAVYIILNQRSAEKTFSPNKLQHPNIRVRTLGGKSFYSHDGKMVVGELKESFILVDLLTVVLGSYSLTWTDAHLHRQLVTVMSGPVVEFFDREFRILYAASLPIPDSWKDAKPIELPKTDVTLHQPEPNIQKQLLQERCPSPPTPITNNPIDWEALGVLKKSDSFQEGDIYPNVFWEETPKYHRAEFNRHNGVTGTGREFGDLYATEWQTENKLFHVDPRHIRDHQGMFGIQNPERLQYGFLSPDREERGSRLRYRDISTEMNLQEDMIPFSRAHRQDCAPNLDWSQEENLVPEMTIPMSTAVSKKKPVVVSVPQTERSWNISDILRKSMRKGARNTLNKSALDLSTQETDIQTNQQANPFESFPLTPALALMKKRNDEVKSSLLRSSVIDQPLSRHRSFSFGPQRDFWRGPFFKNDS